jgi:hypothetical protein
VRLSAGPCYESPITSSPSSSTNLVIGIQRICWKSSPNKQKKNVVIAIFSSLLFITSSLSHTMRPSTFLVSSLAIFGAHAAPAVPKIDLKNVANPAAALDALSDYFNLIASRVQTSKVQQVAPVCDLSKTQMPTRKYSLGARYRHAWTLTNQWDNSSHWTATSICRLDAASRCRRPRHPELHV